MTVDLGQWAGEEKHDGGADDVVVTRRRGDPQECARSHEDDCAVPTVGIRHTSEQRDGPKKGYRAPLIFPDVGQPADCGRYEHDHYGADNCDPWPKPAGEQYVDHCYECEHLDREQDLRAK